MLDQEEVSRALRIFEQRISTPEFEEWVKPIYDGAKHPHFFFGLGNCSSEDSRVADACLCVSTSPTTFSEEDVQQAKHAEAVAKYEKAFINMFGQPASNQCWDFTQGGSFTATRGQVVT